MRVIFSRPKTSVGVFKGAKRVGGRGCGEEKAARGGGGGSRDRPRGEERMPPGGGGEQRSPPGGEKRSPTLRRRRVRATATARGWLTTCFLPFFIFVSCGFPKSANLVYGTGFRGFDIY